MKNWWKEDGQAMTEYSLVIVLVAVVVSGAITSMSGVITIIYNKIKDAVLGAASL